MIEGEFSNRHGQSRRHAELAQDAGGLFAEQVLCAIFQIASRHSRNLLSPASRKLAGLLRL
jgi:hypothetical protein